MKIAFDGLVSRLDILKDRISDLDDKSIDFLKPPNKQIILTTKQREERKKQKQNRIPKECRITTKLTILWECREQETKE